MKQRMNDYLRFLDDEIAHLTKQLMSCPPGKFICTRDANHFKWYVRNGDNLRYVYKRERPYAEQMAYKRYLQERLDSLYKEKRATEYYLKHNGNINNVLPKFYATHSCFWELLKDKIEDMSAYAKEWAAADYTMSQYLPEKKRFRADDGTMVRSKSEAIIASKLFHNNIPYRYECECILPTTVYYPDFTILKPKTNEIVFHEHCGRMDDPQYVSHYNEKIYNYQLGGIYLGQNLTATYETAESPLRFEDVDTLIDRLLSY